VLLITPGRAERFLRARDFGASTRHAPSEEGAARRRRDLARPGRLTAGLVWYRAAARWASGQPLMSVRVPTLGIYGAGDPALAEDRMVSSARRVDAARRCQRLEGVGHRLEIEAAERVNGWLVEWFTGPCRHAGQETAR
jgi:pimeloyl-ACP methyl ester carboxylesterase